MCFAQLYDYPLNCWRCTGVYCPSYFGEHHTGSVSCQLACDGGKCGLDETDTVEVLTNTAVVGTWTGQDDGHE